MAIVALYLGLAAYAVRITPAEETDVYLFQLDAVTAFLNGTDPYTITHKDIFGEHSSYFYAPSLVSQGRVHIGLAYPPLSLLMIVPGYVAGDLRYSSVAALLISVLLLVRIRTDKFALLAVGILLLNPVTFYIVSRGFSEPLVLLTLTLTLFAAERQSRWLPLAFAAFLSSKQYSLLALPFASFLIPNCNWKQGAKLVAYAVGASLIVCAPFAFWDFGHMWNDLVMVSLVAPFRPDSLSFSVLTARLGWGPLSPLVAATAVLGACAWSLKTARREPPLFACCFGFLLLVLLGFHKQAFVNYYFLALGSLLLSAATAGPVSVSRTGTLKRLSGWSEPTNV